MVWMNVWFFPVKKWIHTSLLSGFQWNWWSNMKNIPPNSFIQMFLRVCVWVKSPLTTLPPLLLVLLLLFTTLKASLESGEFLRLSRLSGQRLTQCRLAPPGGNWENNHPRPPGVIPLCRNCFDVKMGFSVAMVTTSLQHCVCTTRVNSQSVCDLLTKSEFKDPFC